MYVLVYIEYQSELCHFVVITDVINNIHMMTITRFNDFEINFKTYFTKFHGFRLMERTLFVTLVVNKVKMNSLNYHNF